MEKVIKGEKLKRRGEVKVRLRGGLGNQLFQISAALCLAQACGLPLKVNTRDLEDSTDHSRGNFLKELALDKLFNLTNLDCSFISENFLANRLHHRFGRQSGRSVISTNFDLLEMIGSHNPKTYRLKGFFQDLRFVQPSIHDNPLITLHTIRSEVAAMSQLVAFEKTITLHIRLGDFIKNGLDVLSSEYFFSAITEFVSQLGESDFKVVVFSDDIQGARAMLHGKRELIFPEQACALSPPELLYVLSNARNIVISKSTLAWWAGYIGYLNGNKVWSPWPDRFEIY